MKEPKIWGPMNLKLRFPKTYITGAVEGAC
ncbi:hypothetical protein TorRG33x02_321650 [Trema orientale]|uniref:Uncharacterized protein n=1 Tax=Trema orientale TaxID=63057 RepID=A0A2P5BGT8_TREOI|nr:hypothetical protein TorRG33x02_321650 [Trema orientale]